MDKYINATAFVGLYCNRYEGNVPDAELDRVTHAIASMPSINLVKSEVDSITERDSTIESLIKHEIDYLEWDINEREQHLYTSIDYLKDEIVVADVNFFVNLTKTSSYSHIVGEYNTIQEKKARKIWLLHLLDRAQRKEV